MPLLHSGPIHSLSPFFHLFGFPSFAWFLVQSFMMTFSLRHATVARLVVFLPVTVSLFCGPQFLWVLTFLKRCLFRHATFAWQDTFLQAAADFLLDQRFSLVLSFLFRWHSVVRMQTLRHFLSSPTGITAASSLGIS
jgi:hypothetical protein